MDDDNIRKKAENKADMLMEIWSDKSVFDEINLSNQYFDTLRSKMECWHWFEICYYSEEEREEIVEKAIGEVRRVLGCFIRANINNGNSEITVRAKLVDIIDFVPMIFEDMSDKNVFIRYDLSYALRRWEEYIEFLKTPQLPYKGIIHIKSERQKTKELKEKQYNTKPKSSTIRRKAQSIKSFCQFLNQYGGYHHTNYESFPDFSKPIYRQSNKVSITTTDIEKIVNKIPTNKNSAVSFIGYRDKAIIIALSHIGLTVSELINLNVNDVDFDNRFITIIHSANRGRRLIIDKDAYWAMKKYYDICIKKYPAPEKFFLTAKGKRISGVSIFKIVKENAEHAGYNHINPQMLRELVKKRMIMHKQKSKIPETLGIKRLYNRNL